MIHNTALILISLLIINPYTTNEQLLSIDDEGSSMTISGSSNVKSWKSNVEQISGSASFTVESAQISKISNLFISVPVGSIKSGKSGMDKKTHNALKKNEYPDISFTLNSYGKKGFRIIECRGKLKIAGKTNPVTMDVKYDVSKYGINVLGSVKVKLSDYDINRPTALLGALKVSDEITITYNVSFKKIES